MQPALHLLSLLMVVLMGFAAHRASLCTVRAVADAIHHRRFGMLLSFVRAALWTAAVAGVLIVVFGLPQPPIPAREPLGWAVCGGFLFGAGAAINGGCSLSTLHRLADGDTSMMLTLAAFCAGVAAWSAVEAGGVASTLSALPSPWTGARRWAALALVALLAWCGVELRSMMRATAPGIPWRERVRTPSYPLPVAAALLGVAGGVLYTVEGAWSYTNYLRATVSHLWGAPVWPGLLHGLLVLALLGGMVLSARSSTSRATTPALAHVWRARISGGTLMGLGAALVPGGNDTLLLGAIPTLSLNAVLVFTALLAGVASVLALRAASTRGRVAPM